MLRYTALDCVNICHTVLHYITLSDCALHRSGIALHRLIVHYIILWCSVPNYIIVRPAPCNIRLHCVDALCSVLCVIYYVILHCIVVQCIVLYIIVYHIVFIYLYIVMHCSILCWIGLDCTVSYQIIVCYPVSYCVMLCYDMVRRCNAKSYNIAKRSIP